MATYVSDPEHAIFVRFQWNYKGSNWERHIRNEIFRDNFKEREKSLENGSK